MRGRGAFGLWLLGFGVQSSGFGVGVRVSNLKSLIDIRCSIFIQSFAFRVWGLSQDQKVPNVRKSPSSNHPITKSITQSFTISQLHHVLSQSLRLFIPLSHRHNFTTSPRPNFTQSLSHLITLLILNHRQTKARRKVQQFLFLFY